MYLQQRNASTVPTGRARSGHGVPSGVGPGCLQPPTRGGSAPGRLDLESVLQPLASILAADPRTSGRFLPRSGTEAPVTEGAGVARTEHRDGVSRSESDRMFR